MKINKNKLKETLDILKITPQYAIDWINDCVDRNISYMCLNNEMWNSKKYIRFEFEGEYDDNNIYIPGCVETKLYGLYYNNFSASTISCLIITNRKYRNKLIKTLKAISKD